MDNGWISIHKKILKWEWYDDPITKSVFLDLLLTANHQTTKYRGTVILRGQTITGYPAMASRLGISVQNARTAIKRLKSTGELTVKSTNKFSIITVINYEKYQSKEGRDNSLINRPPNSQLTGSQQATNNTLRRIRIKEDKKGEEIPTPPPTIPVGTKPEPQKEGWLDFVRLSGAEYQKLKDELGQVILDMYIERLNGWLGQSGKKYKSHYHTIANWVRRDKADGKFLTEKEFYQKEFERLSAPQFVKKYGQEVWENI